MKSLTVSIFYRQCGRLMRVQKRDNRLKRCFDEARRRLASSPIEKLRCSMNETIPEVDIISDRSLRSRHGRMVIVESPAGAC